MQEPRLSLPGLPSPTLPTLALAALFACGCTGGDDDDSAPAGDDDDDAVATFEPSLEYRGSVAVLRVGGSFYDMGFQQGTLLREELLAGAEWIEGSEMALLEPLAEYHGLLEYAYSSSYSEVVDECQGMVDAMDDELWSMNRCMLLAWGDVSLEYINQNTGCSQFVAGGDATADGTLIHGRNLDWTEVRHIIDHPTLIVRFPEDGMPNVVFGFPGGVSTYQGINEAGISIAQNEAHGLADAFLEGRAHSQIERRILREATSLDDVAAILDEEIHGSAEMFVVADGNSGRAAVFEMAVDGVERVELDSNDVAWATNHFVVSDDLHMTPSVNSTARYERLRQLLDPSEDDTLHGTIDLDAAAAILRDTTDGHTGETASPDLSDGADTVANNGCIQSIIFAPQQRTLYLAEGDIPVPQNAFVGFTLDELFSVEGAVGAEPAVIE